MKKKLFTKLGILAIAIMCTVCSFCFAVVSAESNLAAITYVDSTTGETINADSLIKDGYTASADLYSKVYPTFVKPALSEFEEFNGETFTDNMYIENLFVSKCDIFSKDVFNEYTTNKFTNLYLRIDGSNIIKVSGLLNGDEVKTNDNFLVEVGESIYLDVTNVNSTLELLKIETVEVSNLTGVYANNESNLYNYDTANAISVTTIDKGVETKIGSTEDIYTYTTDKDGVIAKVTYTKKAAVVIPTPDTTPAVDEDVEDPTEEVSESPVKEFFGKIKDFFTTTGNTIKDFFTGIVEPIKIFFVNIGNSLKDFFVNVKDFFTPVKDTAEEVVE